MILRDPSFARRPESGGDSASMGPPSRPHVITYIGRQAEIAHKKISFFKLIIVIIRKYTTSHSHVKRDSGIRVVISGIVLRLFSPVSGPGAPRNGFSGGKRGFWGPLITISGAQAGCEVTGRYPPLEAEQDGRMPQDFASRGTAGPDDAWARSTAFRAAPNTNNQFVKARISRTKGG